MDGNSKRFTIYIPQELSQNLKAIRWEAYKDRTQADMLRDLIARGLRECEKQSREVG